jgi:hypothetical protein
MEYEDFFLLLAFVNAQELLFYQLSKVSSTDIQKFLSQIRLKSVSSIVMKFGEGDSFSNAAKLPTYRNEKKDTFITRNLAARTYTMRFPNGRHPSVNVIRRLYQRLRKKFNHDNHIR